MMSGGGAAKATDKRRGKKKTEGVRVAGETAEGQREERGTERLQAGQRDLSVGSA